MGSFDGISVLVRRDSREIALSKCTYTEEGPVSTQLDGDHPQAKRPQNETYFAGILILDF